jgi:cysteine rich repeat protein
MRFTRTLVIAIAVAIPTLALAQQGGVRGACMNDIKTLCSGVQPGGGRVRECFKVHREQLSSGCKLALADRMLARLGRQGRGGSPPGPGGQSSPPPGGPQND